MALFPCDKCGRRYSGRANSVYPAILAGRDSRRAKLRLCEDCAADLTAGLPKGFTEIVEGEHYGELEGSRDCYVAKCQSPADLAVFVTAYLAGLDRRDWFGHVCSDHDGETARMLLIA